MNILINCSNLKKGGGLQVADSICCSLNRFKNHNFFVVLPEHYMDETYNKIVKYKDVKIFRYDVSPKIFAIFTGRDRYLDGLVEVNNIDCVLTIFGPSIWAPKCEHVSGFARAHLVLQESPYFKQMSRAELFKNRILNSLLRYSFNKTSKIYFSENPYISERLKQLFPEKTIYTVTNYYNQVFDDIACQTVYPLESFEGTRLLTVNAPYPHKNMGICVEIAKLLRKQHPDFDFKFTITIDETDIPKIPDYLKKHFELIGKVDVSCCPSLYNQSDICFQPTLLECFTATYAESMRMGIPIVTTDLEFARGLCNNAAEYYSPLSPQSAADAIYNLAIDENKRKSLVENGEKQLRKYDTYIERVEKLLNIIEEISK